MTAQRQTAAELTIGIVGPHDLVERIMLSGSPQPGGLPGATATRRSVRPGRPPTGLGRPARRLVAAAYRSEQEAADKVHRLGPGDRRLPVRQPGAL